MLFDLSQGTLVWHVVIDYNVDTLDVDTSPKEVRGYLQSQCLASQRLL